MESRPSVRGWRATCLLAVMIGSAACGTADDAVQLETLELATGEYYGLSWGGTQVDRFHVVAREGVPGETDGPTVIVSPQRSPPCEVGDHVTRYSPLQPRNSGKYVLGSPSPVRIQIFDEVDDDGFGTLSFSDIDCKRSKVTVPDTSAQNIWRLYSQDLQSLQYAVRTRDNALSLVDPWHDKSAEVAQGVGWVWPTEDGFWLLESGELVLRDLKGRERLRKGKGVSDLYLLGSSGDYAYVEERGLFLNRAGKEKKVASDGCRLRTFDQFLPGAVAYLSPCDTFRLTITTPDDKTYHYGEYVDAYDVQRGRLLFTTVTETTSTFWSVSPDEPDKPERLLEVPRVQIEDIWNGPSGQLRLIVRQLDDSYSILELDLEGEQIVPTLIDEQILAYQTSQRGIATLAQDGTLRLLDRETFQLLSSARGVTRSAFRFAFSGKSTSLVYLSATDPDALLGRLELHVMNGEHFVIADDVREFREVWWPERGILYASSGAEPGIYFARVKIPCENTSETSWACGFQGSR